MFVGFPEVRVRFLIFAYGQVLYFEGCEFKNLKVDMVPRLDPRSQLSKVPDNVRVHFLREMVPNI